MTVYCRCGGEWGKCGCTDPKATPYSWADDELPYGYADCGLSGCMLSEAKEGMRAVGSCVCFTRFTQCWTDAQRRMYATKIAAVFARVKKEREVYALALEKLRALVPEMVATAMEAAEVELGVRK